MWLYGVVYGGMVLYVVVVILYVVVWDIDLSYKYINHILMEIEKETN